MREDYGWWAKVHEYTTRTSSEAYETCKAFDRQTPVIGSETDTESTVHENSVLLAPLMLVHLRGTHAGMTIISHFGG
jgi:hypothetical protein